MEESLKKLKRFDFSKNPEGTISGMCKDIETYDTIVIITENMIKFFQQYDIVCRFKRYLGGNDSGKLLEYDIGGINVILENKDHLRVWNNPSIVDNFFEDGRMFYSMKSFVDFYKDHDLHVFTNKNLINAADTGVFG